MKLAAHLDGQSIARGENFLDPVAAQDVATKAYVDSAVEGLAWKDSVRAASTANINLASPGANIDGIAMAANDRFLAKNQTAPAENGIYVWNGAALPATRAPDASTAAELEQAVVTVEEGGTNANTTWRQTTVNATLGTTAIAFTAFGTGAGAATEATAGLAEIATQAEVDAGTDDARIVTPAKLAAWSGRKMKAVATIGDASATAFAINHNFNTYDVHVSVFLNSGNRDEVLANVTRPSVNQVTVGFTSPPALNAYRVVIIA